MPLATDIANVIANNGVVRAGACHTTKTGTPFLTTGPNDPLDTLCWNATVNVAGNNFTITAQPPNTPGADHVIIGNAASWAAIGQLMGPGVLYSEDFSGCVFFLWRDDFGSVYGAHAYRQSGTYPDPMPYFNRLGAKLLYSFATTGVFAPGNFGTVICNVEANQIIIDFLETNNRNVVRSVDHQVIANWRTAPAIAAPNHGNVTNTVAGAGVVPPPPAAAGLKHRVAKFLLKYI